MAARVIFHADDLGMNPAVDAGVFRGFQQGLLTSASLLANAPNAPVALGEWKRLAQDQAAAALPSSEARRRLSEQNSPFDLGAHLNLSQGRPLTADRYPMELLDELGLFPGIIPVFRALRRRGSRFRPAISAELSRQVQFILDHGLQPTHLNGHQYVEIIPGVAEAVPEIMRKFQIPVVRLPLERRLFRSTFLSGFLFRSWLLGCMKQHYARKFRSLVESADGKYPEAYFGAAHAGRIDFQRVHGWLSGPIPYRSIEICLHPGAAPNRLDQAADGWNDPLAALRPNELQLLISPELPDFLFERRIQLGRLSLL